MRQLSIDLGSRSYPIFIGEQLLGDAGLLGTHIPARAVLVVTNETVGGLHLESLRRGLGALRVETLSLPDGERHKTLATLSRVFDALVAAGINRDGAILALGGGVVGDIAGFAAACYQRGIAYCQAPTTLLAQVDSAVGGKTGVNHPAGKNLIGAFHQPHAVFCDVTTLRTLPEREFRAGLAEVIKYGLIADEAFLRWLEHNLDALLRREVPSLTHAIGRSCEIKAQVVSSDEREHGERAILNFGHTFGHAIEAGTGYSQWLHGEAVAIGMLMATSMSARLGGLKPHDVDRVRALLLRSGLPVSSGGVTATRATELMKLDKKVLGGHVRLVLLRRVGEAVVSGEYDPAALQATLTEFFGT